MSRQVVTRAIVAAAAIAALSTLGDFIWATWISSHQQTLGVAHGALLFAAIGLALGVPAGRTLAGALGGLAAGAGAAGLFYLAAPWLGATAMFIAWSAVWLALAVLNAHLHARRNGLSIVAGGLAAAARAPRSI